MFVRAGLAGAGLHSKNWTTNPADSRRPGFLNFSAEWHFQTMPTPRESSARELNRKIGGRHAIGRRREADLGERHVGSDQCTGRCLAQQGSLVAETARAIGAWMLPKISGRLMVARFAPDQDAQLVGM
jgi:hypothetical protein